MSNRAQLRDKIRGHLRLWPEKDSLSATITSTDTSISVGSASLHPVGSVLEIENELMTVRTVSDPPANPITVRRGDRGTTAAAHTLGVAILNHTQYSATNQELNSLINDGFRWLSPTCLKEIWDESLTTDDSTLFYTIPASILAVDELYITTAGTPTDKRHLRYWKRVDSKLYVPGALPAGRTLTIHGWGFFTLPTDEGSALDLRFELESAVELYVVSLVLKAQEALRSRFTGQSALLEARAGNIPDLIGSSRDWERRASQIRNQHQTIRPTMLRKINRHV